MATLGPRSVLDKGSNENSGRVVRDRITRHKSPGRSPKPAPDDEEIVLRVPQPYRTSFSAVVTPGRARYGDRSRSVSPGTRSLTKSGKKISPKHVTYDQRVTVRHSDTEESQITDLSGSEMPSPRQLLFSDSCSESTQQTPVVSDSYNSTTSYDDTHEYSMQVRQTSQNLRAQKNSPSASADYNRKESPINGVDSGVYPDLEVKHVKKVIYKDYTHDRTVSYRLAIRDHYTDEVRRIAAEMDAADENSQPHQESSSPNKQQDSLSPNKQQDSSPKIEHANSVSSYNKLNNGQLTPSKRSSTSSIGSFFRRLSPNFRRRGSAERQRVGSTASGSAQSLEVSEADSERSGSSYGSHFSRSKVRKSFLKLIGRSKSREKGQKENTDSVHDSNTTHPTAGQQFPAMTNRILKSIEQNTMTDKKVYQKFKDKQSPNAFSKDPVPVSKSHAIKPTESPSSIPTLDFSTCNFPEQETTKVQPPQTLDVKLVPKNVKSLQTSVISTGSGDESLGDCSLDVDLTGSEPSLLTDSSHQSTASRQAFLGDGAVSNTSSFNQNPFISSGQLTSAAKQRLETTPRSNSPLSVHSSAQNVSPQYSIPKFPETGELPTEPLSPRTPSYLKISCAVSGYGKFSAYSSYSNIEKRSPYSSTLSIKSDTSGKEMPAAKTSSYGRTAQSCTKNSPKASTNNVSNGDAPSNHGVMNGHTVDNPTGDPTKDGECYLHIAQREEDRIHRLCSLTESEISSSLPEDVSGKIRAAIGKANLLIDKKFEQFRELCRRHMTPDPDDKPTKWEDLQGFWDMVKIQIDDVEDSFTEIQLMKQNGWREVFIESRRSSNSSLNSHASARSTPSHTPGHTPGSIRKPLKPKDTPDSSPEQSNKAKQAAKARDDARKRMLAEKRAAMKQHNQGNQSVEIYLPEGGKVD